MNTQFTKNSLYIARQNYRLANRKRRLYREFAAFFGILAIVFAAINILFIIK